MPIARAARVLLVCGSACLLSADGAFAQFPQQGPKLVATATPNARVGSSLALSADGNTAIVGSRMFAAGGGAWIFVRNGGVWTQQSQSLIGSAATPGTTQGTSVSISADGNTAIVGGEISGAVGAAWIWTRSNGVWTEQAKLVGSGAGGNSGQGWAVALSGDGNTAIVSAMFDNRSTGAAWIFVRSGTTWTQQGTKLVGTGAIGNAQQGSSVALSFDGSTAIVGSFVDDNLKGAVWFWTRTDGVWSQQGPKRVGTSATFAGQGISVALSADGNTAIVGGYEDDNTAGAAWIWVRSNGTWSQQGSKLTPPTPFPRMGWSVSLSGDGNTALVGGPNDSSGAGVAWIWTRSGGTWTRGASLLGTGAVGNSRQGSAVDLSADGTTAMVGGAEDNSSTGAVWVFSSMATTMPTLSTDRSSVAFSAIDDGAKFAAQTSAQTVRLTQSGTGTITWTAASNVPWLAVSPTSGMGSDTLTISTQYVPGLVSSQTGLVTVTLNGASTTTGPLTVRATLQVLTPSTASSPFGYFDTPINGTTGVTGSIAVTGWALDDVEVTRVRIVRDAVAGEPAGALIFIGDAVQVEGARPDVQAMFPAMPRSTRAGWGYLMLTNFLPALGNGTFTLHAIADDADGHSSLLGSTTITCANSAAIAPIGAIDTPAQGAVVSGMVTNFGWVLSPAPRRADPPSGGTVQVVIDGAVVSAVPSGWTSRPDLTALFPAAQYPGIANALGVAVFDSALLANGVHTIAWTVTDNLGAASGIGSRYFTVFNDSLMLNPVDRVEPSPALRASAAGTDVSTPIRGRRGFDPDTKLQMYSSRDGRVTVQAEELDRIELQLGDAGGRRYTGYLRSGHELGPLPIGSVLEPSTGAFTWMPGVGFSGAYDLVFVQDKGAGAVRRQDVRIVLNPKGTNRVGPQTVIDVASPAAGGSVTLAGWAADLDATADTGVDAIHVWAYNVDSGRPATPVWLGAATYGVRRPDVAAIFGERFLESGYSIELQGIPAGTYDLAVFPYSTVLGRFTPAKTVRVTIGK